MDGDFNPVAEGVTAKGPPVLDANGFIPKYELKVGQARTLAGFDREFTFFTPAILYLHGGFMDAPLADLIADSGADIRFYYRKFDRPVFAGLDAPSNGNRDWNHVLWAVRAEHWPLVSTWLVSITLSYADAGEVAGIGEQVFDVPDPLATDRFVVAAGPLPALRVYAFGINGSRFRAYLVAGGGPPRLAFDDPTTEMRVFAEALYGGGNPVAARALHRRREDRHEG